MKEYAIVAEFCAELCKNLDHHVLPFGKATGGRGPETPYSVGIGFPYIILGTLEENIGNIARTMAGELSTENEPLEFRILQKIFRAGETCVIGRFGPICVRHTTWNDPSVINHKFEIVYRSKSE